MNSLHGVSGDPYQTSPLSPTARCDRFAVALANASLLGIGYLILGRRGLALANACCGIALVTTLAVVDPPAWWLRVPLLVLLAAAPLHGWFLAGSHGSVPDRPWRVSTQRVVALATAAPVLLSLAGLRFDAHRIEQAAAAEHREGDCVRAVAEWDRFGPAHQAADGLTAVRAREARQACVLLLEAESVAETDRLRAERLLRSYQAHPGALWEGASDRRADLLIVQAEIELHRALQGAHKDAEEGFERLASVLRGSPDHEGRIRSVLDAFVDDLLDTDPCRRKQIADELSGGEPATGERTGALPAGGKAGGALRSAYSAIEQATPAAILACADETRPLDPKAARAHYRQLLDEYPDHPLAARAERGLVKARQAIELEKVRELVRPPFPDVPDYCDNPAPYSAAPPYRGKGPHRAMLFGNDHEQTFPKSWRADDVADAVLIICAGEADYGTAVETCPYESEISVTGAVDVTFHRKRVPIRVFEVRTGRLVTETNVEIDGAGCPEVLEYETYLPHDLGPPSQVYVDPSRSDVRRAAAPAG